MTRDTRTDAPILCEIKDGICHIVLNDPPYNMMDKRWSDHLSGTINGIDASNIDGIVISAAARHFSAGAVLDDIRETASSSYQAAYQDTAFPMSRDSVSFQKLSEFPLPVVGAIRGVCIGSGFELALACHYRVCDKNAAMGLVETTFGLMPGCGGTLRLPALVGTARGLEMILTGERFSSEDALRMGIVSEIVHHSELISTATQYIRRLAPYYRARYRSQ